MAVRILGRHTKKTNPMARWKVARYAKQVRRERRWLSKQSKARSMRTGKPAARLIRAFIHGRRVSKQL